MPFAFAVFTFVNVWWLTLFAVLPLNIKMEDHKSGIEYAGAPKTPRWKKVFLINSCISLVVTALIALLLHSGAISLRDVIKIK